MADIYQLFKDKGSGPAMVFYKYDKEKFSKLNKEGYGIYKAVNDFDATEEEMKELAIKKGKNKVSKRNTEFLKKLKFVYADIDFAKNGDWQLQESIDEKKIALGMILSIHCEPNFIINTKNGIQPFRKIDEDKVDKETQNRYVNIINGIIEWSKDNGGMGDNVKDCARVLRVPGFYHMKGEPYLITVDKLHDNTYTLDQLQEKFPFTPKEDNATTDNIGHTSTSKHFNNSNNVHSLQFREVELLDIQDVAIKAFSAVGRDASFDRQKRLILDGRLTGTHQGKTGDCNFLASSSHEPFVGNSVTVVADIMGISNKESYRRLLDTFNIKSETELKKKYEPVIKKKKIEGDMPLKFKDSGILKFSTGNRYIDIEVGHFWSKELVMIHGDSGSGKTSFTMSLANTNGMSVDEGGHGHKVAFFSLEMDTKKLKVQQAAIRSGINRVDYETGNYTDEQWDIYEKTYIGFDKHFTIFDENDLEGSITLDVIITQIEKLHQEGYKLFIIDSLKLIGGQKMKSNARESKVIKDLRELKNRIKVCIVLIHHNSKGGSTFSGSQDLRNFSDWMIQISKVIDPDSDGKIIFNQTKIKIYKERLGAEVNFTFDYINGKLRFSEITTVEEEEKTERLARKPLYG